MGEELLIEQSRWQMTMSRARACSEVDERHAVASHCERPVRPQPPLCRELQVGQRTAGEGR